MLHNILLSADLSTEITKQGKFVNVVLAAGEITARIRMMDDSTLETKLVSGMAFPVLQGYKSVSFVSDVDQQTKIWLGDLPLTYSPLDSKLVGSSAVSSISGQVFSGENSLLLPAKVGRNKVTISPSKDIFLGGVGLSPESAIKIMANTIFSLNTQGAVYAYEDSGNYKKTYTASFNESDLVLSKDLTTTNPFQTIAKNNSGTEFLCTEASSTTLFRMALDDLSLLGTVAIGRSVVGYYNVVQDGYLYMSTANGVEGYLTAVDLTDYTVSHTLIDPLKSFERFDFYGSKKVFVDRSNAAPYSVYFDAGAGEGIVSVSGITGVSGYCYAAIITNTGKIIASFLNNFAVSTDNGATWSVSLTPGTSLGEKQMTVDRKTGNIFFLSSTSVLYRSTDDGVSWGVMPISLNIAQAVISNQGTIVATGYNLFVSMDSGGSWIEADSTGVAPSIRGAVVGKGEIFTVKKSGAVRTVSAFTGDVVEVGGLPVAIMQEVN